MLASGWLSPRSKNLYHVFRSARLSRDILAFIHVFILQSIDFFILFFSILFYLIFYFFFILFHLFIFPFSYFVSFSVPALNLTRLFHGLFFFLAPMMMWPQSISNISSVTPEKLAIAPFSFRISYFHYFVFNLFSYLNISSSIFENFFIVFPYSFSSCESFSVFRTLKYPYIWSSLFTFLRLFFNYFP